MKVELGVKLRHLVEVYPGFYSQLSLTKLVFLRSPILDEKDRNSQKFTASLKLSSSQPCF